MLQEMAGRSRSSKKLCRLLPRDGAREAMVDFGITHACMCIPIDTPLFRELLVHSIVPVLYYDLVIERAGKAAGKAHLCQHPHCRTVFSRESGTSTKLTSKLTREFKVLVGTLGYWGALVGGSSELIDFPFFTTLSHAHFSLPSPLASLSLFHNNITCLPFPSLSWLHHFHISQQCNLSLPSPLASFYPFHNNVSCPPFPSLSSGIPCPFFTTFQSAHLSLPSYFYHCSAHLKGKYVQNQKTP
jgi:hypothetical protein